MKRICLFSFALLLSLFVTAQQLNPSYPEIIKSFCSQYEPIEAYEDYTAFAKKREGWYVLQINKIKSDSILKEILFYSFLEKKFNDLSTYYNKAENPEVEKHLERYLNYGGSIFDWYAFERIPYYGYNGWSLDVIEDFGNKENLSDTIYDGVGRAYGNLAQSYTWHQQGGLYPKDDTLHVKLKRLQYPSAARVKEMRQALINSITKFELLGKKNPQYVTLIGNAELKVFNEYMSAYSQLTMCKQDKLAAEFIAKANLSEPYIIQAKNYLNSCEPDAVLFTYGDNDTYQLWYLQEKYNYRKDVTVINYNLLGLPVYIHMLKRNKSVKITTPDYFIINAGNDICYYKQPVKTTVSEKGISLQLLLQRLYKRKNVIELSNNTTAPAYLSKSAYIEKVVAGLKKRIPLNLDTYHYINDIIVFDILVNTINTRPLYFTTNIISYLENYIREKGIVYELIPNNATTSTQKIGTTRELEKFIIEKYKPVLSVPDKILCNEGDISFFTLYYTLFNYYLAKKDTAACKKWLLKLEESCSKINTAQLKAAKNLIYIYSFTGNEKKAISLSEQYAAWLNEAYLKPSSLNGYYSKKAFTDELRLIQSMLSVNNYESSLVEQLLNNLY